MNTRLAVLLAVLGALLALKWIDGPRLAAPAAIAPAASSPTAVVAVAAAQMPTVERQPERFSGPSMPWPVAGDPFTAPAPKEVASVAKPPPAPPAPPPPAPPPPPPPPPRPVPTVFGALRQDNAMRVLLQTPGGVVVAGAGDRVMGLRVERIEPTTITLVPETGGAAVTLPMPALAPDKNTGTNDVSR